MNQLEQLRLRSVVVADTGDLHEIAHYAPRDATTNPSLVLKAAQDPKYQDLVSSVARAHKGLPLDEACDRLLVRLGQQILAIVPGRVSTEVDASLSFDTAGTIVRGKRLISMYESLGIARSRVLIKIPATWEGIQAASVLEGMDIHCNMTLVFSLHQAVACAEAGATLISPFVGRIGDWYRQRLGAAWQEADNLGSRDPGVRSVAAIHRHFKAFGLRTQIMAASFRRLDQIHALAGCDLITISPDLLRQLQSRQEPFQGGLTAEPDTDEPSRPIDCDEASFRRALSANAMAAEKLSEGIDVFTRDSLALASLVEAAMAQSNT